MSTPLGLRLALLLLSWCAIAGCSPAGPAASQGTTSRAPSASASTGPLGPSADAPPSSEAPGSSQPPAPGPVLFSYEEDGDRVELVSPRTTRTIRKSGKTCIDELPDNGNMYSGPEVERAFAHPDVQAALKAHQTYGAESNGKLVAPDKPGSITWATSCRGCLEPPAGVSALHGVLVVLMRNRRLLCP